MPLPLRPDRAAVVATIVLSICVLAPSVAWFDSGELAATATELGVPHPTGFALFNLAGHTFVRIPLASAALRVHLLGAVAAVLAAWIWLRALTPQPVVPISKPARALTFLWTTALLLLPLAAPSVLLHVRAAEVYPLVWLILAATVAAWVRLPPGRRTVALGLLSGLGLGVHVEAALLPGVACVVSGLTLRPGQRVPAWRPLAAATVLGLCAASAVVYLPLAASRNPAFSWGDVRTPAALLDHLTGASIRHAFAGETGPGHYLSGLEALGRLLWRDCRWLLAPALLGIVTSLRHARPALVLTLLVLLADAAYSALVNPMGLRDDQAGLLVVLGLGVLAAVGLQALVQGAARAPVAAVLSLLGIAWTGALLAQTLAVRPQADLDGGARYADRLWRGAAPGTLLLSSSDTRGSACAWTQAGEGVRPDCLCMPLVFARSPEQLRRLAARTQRPELAQAALLLDRPWTPARAADVLAAWLRPSLQAGDVAWELGLAAEDAQVEAHLRPGFPWNHVVPDRVEPAARAQAARAQADAIEAFCAQGLPQTPQGCRQTPMLSQALGLHLGVYAALLMRRDAPVAQELLHRAAVLAPHDAKILNNLAVLDLDAGRPLAALARTEAALAEDPGYVAGHRTAARAALRAGQPGRAVAEAALYLQARRGHPDAQAWLESLAAEAPPEVAAVLRALPHQP